MAAYPAPLLLMILYVLKRNQPGHQQIRPRNVESLPEDSVKSPQEKVAAYLNSEIQTSADVVRTKS